MTVSGSPAAPYDASTTPLTAHLNKRMVELHGVAVAIDGVDVVRRLGGCLGGAGCAAGATRFGRVVAHRRHDVALRRPGYVQPSIGQLHWRTLMRAHPSCPAAVGFATAYVRGLLNRDDEA